MKAFNSFSLGGKSNYKITIIDIEHYIDFSSMKIINSKSNVEGYVRRRSLRPSLSAGTASTTSLKTITPSNQAVNQSDIIKENSFNEFEKLNEFNSIKTFYYNLCILNYP